MSDKIATLRESIKKDIEKIAQLQDNVAKKKAKLKELDNAVILHDIRLLTAQGIEIKELLSAIEKKDKAKIMNYLKEENKTDE